MGEDSAGRTEERRVGERGEGRGGEGGGWCGEVREGGWGREVIWGDIQ